MRRHSVRARAKQDRHARAGAGRSVRFVRFPPTPRNIANDLPHNNRWRWGMAYINSKILWAACRDQDMATRGSLALQSRFLYLFSHIHSSEPRWRTWHENSVSSCTEHA
jgi:hypothetical protein